VVTSRGAVATIDLGATSGRVMLGHIGPGELRLTPMSRFPNLPVRSADGLHWDIEDLYRNAVTGLANAAHQEPELASIGVDSWGCDYGLVGAGKLLSTPYHYRDDRTATAVDWVHDRASAEELYAANGLQHLPFNTLFQLAADQSAGSLDAVDLFLLIPDLFAYRLTGRRFAEKTNASTTGLLGVRSREWDETLIRALGLPRGIFPELIGAGSSIGALLPAVSEEIGAGPRLTVTAVGSHDTASAVVAIPASTDDAAYISCGTWSLVGVELEQPVVSEAGRLAGFTNEGGVDGRVRYLHNVMGLWLLNESIRTWELSGEHIDLASLLNQAAAVTKAVAIFDPDDPGFLPPGDMPKRIAEFCQARGLPVPHSRPELVRSVLESLADAYAHTLEQARQLTGKTISVVHLVGGGSQNELLCQLTADRTGLPLLAGPVEATAIGNVLVQARTQGFITGTLESLRGLVVAAFPPTRYLPRLANQ
jgi:rhamnulokinase